MTIQKLAHSCIRLEKEDNVLLFDPGYFVSEAARTSLGRVDTVVITHSHRDHYDAAFVQMLAASGAAVFAPQELTLELIKAGIPAKALRTNAVLAIGPYSLQVLTGEHEPMPMPKVAANAPVLVDGRFLHPGDSLHVDAPQGLELLALPYAAPWGTLMDAVACVERMRPLRVLPIHDGMYKDSFRDGQAEHLAKALVPLGIETRDLAPEEILDLGEPA